MGKSHDLATLKDDGLTIKNRLEVNHSTNSLSAFPSGDWAAKIYNQYDASTEGGLVVANRWAAGASTALLVGGLYDAGNGFDEFLKVDGVGRVTTPYQPSFLVHGSGGWLSGSANGVGGWSYGTNFTNVQHNQGNHYNTSNYRFTVPVSGVYFLYIQAYHSATAYARTQLFINGSYNGSPYGLVHGRNTSGDSTACSAMNVHLNAGDYVNPALLMDNGSIYYGAGHTYFCGYLIG